MAFLEREEEGVQIAQGSQDKPLSHLVNELW